MITIGYNQVQEKHIADSNSSAREDAHEAKKVYVGNKLAHVHVNDNTEFALRQTLNGYIHEDNDLYAKVSKIKGNTKVWNQLCRNINSSQKDGITFTSNSDGSITINGTSTQKVFSATVALYQVSGHMYYISLNSKDNITNITFEGRNLLGFPGLMGTNKHVAMATSESGNQNVAIGVRANATVTSVTVQPMIIDLTLIYGAGNEPTTVAEFEADFQKWFGRPIGAEPYDAGSLIPFLSTGIKSVGFNLWDEEWEVGIYIANTGIKDSNPDFIRCSNFIEVAPGTNYYYKISNANTRILFYDFNKNFISSTNAVHNDEFTTPTNCKFMTFYVLGTTYNHDICINLSNPTLNGTYVPYKATTLPIPVTTLTGKAEGSTTSEVIFPDGMKSAGSVKDEVYVENGKTYAVKRVGSVDLGSLTWNYNSEFGGYIGGSIDPIPIAAYNALCSHYPFMGIYRNVSDKQSGYIFNTAILIKDSSYTDATTFKAAMSGVMLYYELATPIVYEVDNYTLPLYYVANGTGTEEILSTATSAPADMDIEYRLRQRVRLVDMGTPGVLWADSDIDITKPDGFCDSAFTYDKSFFSWGNVVGHNPISNTAFDYDWGGVNQAAPWYEGQAYGSTPGSTLTGNIPADAQYDAAKAVLGGNWRMPSNAEYDALFRICKFLEADGSDMDTSKTDKRVDMPDGNGGTVKGIYIESTVTRNRLFFSCSGFGDGRSWNNRGSFGYYWSSTWLSARNARLLRFYSGGVYPSYYNNRYLGFALRPVYPISQ